MEIRPLDRQAGVEAPISRGLVSTRPPWGKHRYKTLCLCAVASVIAIGIGLSGPVQAAEGIDYNSSRSNKTSGIADPVGGGETGDSGRLVEALQDETKGLSSDIEAFEAALSEMSIQLSLLKQQRDAIDQRKLQLETLLDQASASSEQQTLVIDEASALFSERIASLLDPALAGQVNDSLNQLRSSNSGLQVSGQLELLSAADFTGDALSDLATIETLLSELSAAAQAAKEKAAQVSRSNVSNN
jgi:hypothetical protein